MLPIVLQRVKTKMDGGVSHDSLLNKFEVSLTFASHLTSGLHGDEWKLGAIGPGCVGDSFEASPGGSPKRRLSVPPLPLADWATPCLEAPCSECFSSSRLACLPGGFPA